MAKFFALHRITENLKELGPRGSKVNLDSFIPRSTRIMVSFTLKIFLLALFPLYLCSGSKRIQKRKSTEGCAKSGNSVVPKKSRTDTENSLDSYVDSLIRSRFIVEEKEPINSRQVLDKAQSSPCSSAPQTPDQTSKYATAESPGTTYSTKTVNSATDSMIDEFAELEWEIANDRLSVGRIGPENGEVSYPMISNIRDT